MSNTGGPAFPVIGAPGASEDYPGMSLLDYFAAKAMHAELATAGLLDEPAQALANAAVEAGRSIPQQIAFNAYLIAEAMLVERESEKPR